MVWRAGEGRRVGGCASRGEGWGGQSIGGRGRSGRRRQEQSRRLREVGCQGVELGVEAVGGGVAAGERVAGVDRLQLRGAGGGG